MATETFAIYGFALNGRKPIRQSGVHDVLHGLAGKSVRAPFYLRMIKDGILLTGAQTLAELNLPQWGNGSQTMEEVLPVLPAKVPKLLPSPFWGWSTYDPNDPATHPTQDPFEIWAGQQGNAMYWELEGDVAGKYFQGAGNSVHITDDDGNLTVWNAIGVKRYRRMNQGTAPVQIPNPEYPVVEAERAAKKAQFIAILKPILVPVGQYQFRGFPTGDDPMRTDPTKYGYGWRINGVDIPVDPSHRLAVPQSGYKFLEAPMRNPEWDKYNPTVNLYEKYLNKHLLDALEVSPHEMRMRVLLHL